MATRNPMDGLHSDMESLSRNPLHTPIVGLKWLFGMFVMPFAAVAGGVLSLKAKAAGAALKAAWRHRFGAEPAAAGRGQSGHMPTPAPAARPAPAPARDSVRRPTAAPKALSSSAAAREAKWLAAEHILQIRAETTGSLSAAEASRRIGLTPRQGRAALAFHAAHERDAAGDFRKADSGSSAAGWRPEPQGLLGPLPRPARTAEEKARRLEESWKLGERIAAARAETPGLTVSEAAQSLGASSFTGYVAAKTHETHDRIEANGKTEYVRRSEAANSAIPDSRAADGAAEAEAEAEDQPDTETASEAEADLFDRQAPLPLPGDWSRAEAAEQAAAAETEPETANENRADADGEAPFLPRPPRQSHSGSSSSSSSSAAA